MSQGFTKNTGSTAGLANAPVNTNVTSMTGLTGTLQAPTGITSAAGENLLSFLYLASAVNYIRINNNTTTHNPIILATGSDAAVGLFISTKSGAVNITDILGAISVPLRLYNAANTHYFGIKSVTASTGPDVDFTWPQTTGSANFVMKTDGVNALSFGNASQLAGTATNDNATTGNVGEYLTNSGSGALGSTAAAQNLITLSLTAGDWDVWGNALYQFSANTGSQCYGGITTTSASYPASPLTYNFVSSASDLIAINAITPVTRISISTTTTVYFVGACVFSTGTASVIASIYARRAR